MFPKSRPPLQWFGAVLAACVFAAAAGAFAQGVEVDEGSTFKTLVPAEELEQAAGQQYAELLAQARAKRVLAPEGNPQLVRLRAIAQRLIPNASRFNPRAREWKWEVNLIGSKQINAFCMPGGKIAFFSGLLDTLKLTDDEVAVVMGHEIGHAVREHARARIAKNQLTQLGAGLLGSALGGGRYADLFQIGGNLLSLKFSRTDERDADVVGLDIAARSGYDPRAGITLWRKMNTSSGSSPPAWLSTHPAGKDRIREIERRLPEVMPLFEQSKKNP